MTKGNKSVAVHDVKLNKGDLLGLVFPIQNRSFVLGNYYQLDTDENGMVILKTKKQRDDFNKIKEIIKAEEKSKSI